MLKVLFASVSAVALSGCIIIATESEDAGYAAKRHDAQRHLGGDIRITLDEAGDFSVDGGDVELSGRVGGKLNVDAADFVARGLAVGALDADAADVRYRGSVAGALDADSADFRFEGEIGGDARIDAADVRLAGSVAGDLEIDAADVDLEGRFADVDVDAADLRVREGSELASLKADVASLRFAGRVTGAFEVDGRTVILSGAVDGPVVVNADPGRRPHGRNDGRVEISGPIGGGFICGRAVELSGPVNGPLEVVADSAPELAGPAQAADITYSQRQGRCGRD